MKQTATDRPRRFGKGAVAAICMALIGGALLVPAAEARIEGPYKLEFGFAKRAIMKATAEICKRAEGCVTWSVKPCRRRSWHRIDCASNTLFTENIVCRFVMIAKWPRWSDELLLQRKRVFCTQVAPGPGG